MRLTRYLPAVAMLIAAGVVALDHQAVGAFDEAQRALIYTCGLLRGQAGTAAAFHVRDKRVEPDFCKPYRKTAEEQGIQTWPWVGPETEM